MPVERGIEDGTENDDTEGNAIKFKGVSNGDEDGDTEGNAFRH